MQVPQVEIATSEAARLVLCNLERVIRDVSTPLEYIRGALVPIFGIRWDAQIIRRIGSERLREILWPRRNSKLGEATYGRVRFCGNPRI